jgi:hypothetical protein
MTNGEAAINRAIEALEEALGAGDEAEEAMPDNRRTAAAEIEKCLGYLTSMWAKELAEQTWGLEAERRS